MDPTTQAPLTNAVLEVRIQCPPVLASYLEELLWTIEGVESVCETYNNERTDDETRPSDLSYMSILTRNPLGEDLVKVLMVQNPKLMKVCDIVGTKWIEEKDWAESWKQHWKPTHITEKLTICPTWEEYTPQSADEVVIVLDPECAFGTGTHETTQLMLKLLQELADGTDLSQKNLLDVGTGSGILGIYAAKRGCKEVKGLDNDALAVQTAIKNALQNQVESACEFTDTPLGELCHTPYDILLANIIAPVILELFPDMLARLSPGALFYASGLIETSVGKVEAAMQEAGFSDIQRRQQGDWFAISGVYKS
ncbi:50S ribosomal protein L11 methyltransferase [Vampirovibrio sp.]|uniref:50S ribosomal protein L11 methyltransferase n=1 Tax=Vampirovibrio sp. TaxID=2717857 RepID=UPI003593FB52